jgi:hypothetical protein
MKKPPTKRPPRRRDTDYAGRSTRGRREVTLTRTKSLLKAALRVWELKQPYHIPPDG